MADARSESEHYKCVFEALTRQCNKATATAVVQFNIKKQQPQLAASINCQLGTFYSYVLSYNACDLFYTVF